MKYAAVIIPTLNRYEHFKDCLESLEACSGAEKTDVIIGLDYPPAEKYVEGWRKIDEFLKEKQANNSFARLIVHKRDHNCGIMSSTSNASLLVDYVKKNYDTFIFSEDDNVFSPNFLEYINQGLEKYKEDPNCLTICGYNYYSVKLDSYNKNIYLSHEFSAWGAGYWTEKCEETSRIISLDYLRTIPTSWSKWFSIYKHEPRLLNTVLLSIQSNKVFGDTARVCYQYLENKYSVFPVKSKVKNLGFDNSGTTIFKEDSNYGLQEIDTDASFKIDEIRPIVEKNTQSEVESFFKRSTAMNLLIFIRMCIYSLTGIDICLRTIKKRNPSLFR